MQATTSWVHHWNTDEKVLERRLMRMKSWKPQTGPQWLIVRTWLWSHLWFSKLSCVSCIMDQCTVRFLGEGEGACNRAYGLWVLNDTSCQQDAIHRFWTGNCHQLFAIFFELSKCTSLVDGWVGAGGCGWVRVGWVGSPSHSLALGCCVGGFVFKQQLGKTRKRCQRKEATFKQKWLPTMQRPTFTHLSQMGKTDNRISKKLFFIECWGVDKVLGRPCFALANSFGHATNLFFGSNAWQTRFCHSVRGRWCFHSKWFLTSFRHFSGTGPGREMEEQERKFENKVKSIKYFNPRLSDTFSITLAKVPGQGNWLIWLGHLTFVRFSSPSSLPLCPCVWRRPKMSQKLFNPSDFKKWKNLCSSASESHIYLFVCHFLRAFGLHLDLDFDEENLEKYREQKQH